MKGVKCILVAVLVLCATVALASEGGGEAHHHLDWWNFFLRVVNFVIFAAILWKFGGKKAIEFFGGRRKQIETQLTELLFAREQHRGDDSLLRRLLSI